MTDYQKGELVYVFIIRSAIKRGQLIQDIVKELDQLLIQEITQNEREQFKRTLSRIWNNEIDKWHIRNG